MRRYAIAEFHDISVKLLFGGILPNPWRRIPLMRVGAANVNVEEKTMVEKNKGWMSYQPSKVVLAWSCAGTAVATMIIGFAWGGWVTAGSAAERADSAAGAARAELAAAICVDRFMNAPDLPVRHAALMEESSWGRDGVIEDAGWTTFVGIEDPVDGAADLCADRLAETELPALSEEAAASNVEEIEAN